jgi:Flp pilus assembly protein TadG
MNHIRFDKQGHMALYFALLLPILIMFGSLGVDYGWISYHRQKMYNTAESSALAGAQELSTYYTTGTATTIQSASTYISQLNMPVNRYGTVLPVTNITLGNWNNTTKIFTSLTASGGNMPDSVSATTTMTVPNGNPLNIPLFGFFAPSSVNISTTSIATYGTGKTFNTIILNDTSTSFASEIANQQNIDSDILSCIIKNAGPNSQFGITTFDGHATIFQPLTVARTNASAISAKISSLQSCGTGPNAPACSGSNVASGLYSAISQFNNSAYNNTINNIILVTDGVPNASSTNYTEADGTYPSGNGSDASGSIYPAATGSPVCLGTKCNDADLWTMAQNQANFAGSMGINVSTVYYSGDTVTSEQITYANQLSSLRQGHGISLVAPSPATIEAAFLPFCSTMGSKAVAIVK